MIYLADYNRLEELLEELKQINKELKNKQIENIVLEIDKILNSDD